MNKLGDVQISVLETTLPSPLLLTDRRDSADAVTTTEALRYNNELKARRLCVAMGGT